MSRHTPLTRAYVCRYVCYTTNTIFHRARALYPRRTWCHFVATGDENRPNSATARCVPLPCIATRARSPYVRQPFRAVIATSVGLLKTDPSRDACAKQQTPFAKTTGESNATSARRRRRVRVTTGRMCGQSHRSINSAFRSTVLNTLRYDPYLHITSSACCVHRVLLC